MFVCLLVCFIIFYVYSCACLSSSIFAYVAVYIFVCVLAGLITSLFTCPKAICYMTEMLAIGNYSLNKKKLNPLNKKKKKNDKTCYRADSQGMHRAKTIVNAGLKAITS